MFSSLYEGFRNGVERIRNHPQLAYTILIALVIFASFIFIAYRFISIATDAQERLINVRIGSIHDTFVQFAENEMSDPSVLQKSIVQIAELNPTIQSFRVVSFRADGREPVIIADLNDARVGERDTGNQTLYQHARFQPDQSFTFKRSTEAERFFVTVRGIANDEGDVVGAVLTRQTLSEADRAINANIRNSIIVFLIILVLVMLLFLRHSRIIDYAQLYKKLKDLDKMKDDFISMASHELRTPLSHIRGYVDMLTDTKDITSDTKKTLTHIDEQAKQLDGFVESMLDVKRIEQGRMKFEFQDVRPDRVIEQVVEDSRRSAEEKGLKLNYDIKDSARIHVDPNRLGQVLTNLIGNAVKYTDEGEILVKQYKEKDNLVIRVHDTGAGMSAEEQKQIFQKFSRVCTVEQQNKIKGTGLGLWITQRIVEQMGGSIGVESIKGVGSDFIVRFPINQ